MCKMNTTNNLYAGRLSESLGTTRAAGEALVVARRN